MDEAVKTLYFVPTEGGDLNHLMTEESLNILRVFRAAISNSNTWGEFWGNLDAPTTEFCQYFTTVLEDISEYEGALFGIAPYAPLKEIEGAVYLLTGEEGFPYIQCASESYQAVKNFLPENFPQDGVLWIHSCSDLDTPLFENSRLKELDNHLSIHGIKIRVGEI